MSETTVQPEASDDDLEPVEAREAFRDDSPSAIASQAVYLLSFSAALGGHIEAIPDEPELPMPDALRSVSRSGGVFGPRLAAQALARRLDVDEEQVLFDREFSIESLQLTPLVDELMERPTEESITALVEGGLRNPHELVRVAAAASALDTVGARDDVVAILRAGALSDDEDMVGPIARAGLNRVDPEDEVLRSLRRDESEIADVDQKSNTSIITHGTFPSSSEWWKPGRDFYDYLANETPPPDLHLHGSSFDWSGVWSASARRSAAFRLDTWVEAEGIGVESLDFFGHSHGVTIAHLATRLRNRDFRRLVALSWPHRCEWRPDFHRVGKILDIRVKADAAIIAERARQNFDVGGVEQNKITTLKNGWFNHSSPRKSSYWNKHDLVDELQDWWP